MRIQTIVASLKFNIGAFFKISLAMATAGPRLDSFKIPRSTHEGFKPSGKFFINHRNAPV